MGEYSAHALDSITQIALGATIGEAFFRRRLGGKAPIVGGLCGLLPDADFLLSIGDPWAGLAQHRAESHSLLVLSVVAFGAGALAWRWAKRRDDYLTWVHLAFWALITHALLDLCTAYGTQLFAPVSRVRFALDAVSIVDPIYSVPLFLAVALAIRKSGRRFARRVAASTLVVTTLYLGYGYWSSQHAIEVAAVQLREDGVEIARIRALPTLLNSELHRVVARDVRGGFHVGYYSAIAPRRIDFQAVASVDGDVRVASALASERGQLFSWFSMGMTWASVESADGEADLGDIVLSDERYGLYSAPTTSMLRARASVDEGGTVRTVALLPWAEGYDTRAELALMWRLLTTGAP